MAYNKQITITPNTAYKLNMTPKQLDDEYYRVQSSLLKFRGVL